MNVLMMCPANVATGGVESIHKFAYELNKIKNMDVKIYYVNLKSSNPQPPEYAEYGIDYVTELPEGYKDVIIFPDIWANRVNDEIYKDCIKAINWAGVDVYYWNNPIETQGDFLKQKDVIHLVQMQYAKDHLMERGVKENHIIHVSDVPNKLFYEDYEEVPRNNLVLFNPLKVTDFQRLVMNRAKGMNIAFKPLEHLTREQMAQAMREAKLYIDFGVFSGRERIPREAVLSGCCVLTSRSGCAEYYEDVALDDKWKFEVSEPNNVANVLNTMLDILRHYDECKNEFDSYRKSLRKDREDLPKDCKKIAKAFLGARK